MGLRDFTMKILLVLYNSQKKILLIYSILLLYLTQGIHEKYLSWMRSNMDRQFLLAFTFTFPVTSLVPHTEELFMTKLPTMLHIQILFLRYLLLVHIILLKNK